MQLPHIFLAGVSVTCCAEGSTSKFLASVSAARCEEAAVDNFLAVISLALGYDGTTAYFQEGVSVPHWKDARSCRKFLAGVYAALCKDAATPKILADVPVGRCTDGATAKFLTGWNYRNRFCVSL